MSDNEIRKCSKDCPFFLRVVKDPWEEINQEPYRSNEIYSAELEKIWWEYGGILARCALLGTGKLSFIKLKCPIKDFDYEAALLRVDSVHKSKISISSVN